MLKCSVINCKFNRNTECRGEECRQVTGKPAGADVVTLSMSCENFAPLDILS